MNALVACVSARNDFALFLKACGSAGMILTDTSGYEPLPIHNTPNLPPITRYQQAFEEAQRRGNDRLILIHDDVEIFDDKWLLKIDSHFDQRPQCAVLGFGGATELGHRDLYKRRYRIEDLARQDYASAQRDWEIHGEKLTHPRRVAVIDGFVMAIDCKFLSDAGGWPVKTNIAHHCYDLWLCCMAARHEREVWALPIDCLHHGGRTTCSPEYVMACRERGTTPERDHAEPHLTIYNEFRDVLPLRVK